MRVAPWTFEHVEKYSNRQFDEGSINCVGDDLFCN